MMNINLQELQSAAVATLIGEVNGLIEGANEDIQGFLNAIVQDSLEAAAEGRLDLLPALEDQSRVLAERNRIRFVNGEERAAMLAIRVALGVATKLVLPTIPMV